MVVTVFDKNASVDVLELIAECRVSQTVKKKRVLALVDSTESEDDVPLTYISLKFISTSRG